MASLHAEIPSPEAEQERLGRAADAVAPEIAEDRYRRTLRAPADIDVGRLIDDAAMKAWADSLETGNELPPPDPD